MNSDLVGVVDRCSNYVKYIVIVKLKLMCLTYSSHGVDAVNVVVGPASGQLVGVLLLLCMDTKTD